MENFLYRKYTTLRLRWFATSSTLLRSFEVEWIVAEDKALSPTWLQSRLLPPLNIAQQYSDFLSTSSLSRWESSLSLNNLSQVETLKPECNPKMSEKLNTMESFESGSKDQDIELPPIIGPYDLPTREQSAKYLKQLEKNELLTYEAVTPEMSTDIKIFTAVLLFVVILFAILLIILAHFLWPERLVSLPEGPFNCRWWV